MGGCHCDMHQPLINEVSRPLFKIQGSQLRGLKGGTGCGAGGKRGGGHSATLHWGVLLSFFFTSLDTPTSLFTLRRLSSLRVHQEHEK